MLTLREEAPGSRRSRRPQNTYDCPVAGFVSVNPQRTPRGGSRFPYGISRVWEAVPIARYEENPGSWLSLPESRFLLASSFDAAEEIRQTWEQRQLPSGLTD